MAGDFIDQKEVAFAWSPFVFSSGHDQFYKGLSLNKFYIKRFDIQEKIRPKKFFSNGEKGPGNILPSPRPTPGNSCCPETR
jgi:hypothetical protein